MNRPKIDIPPITPGGSAEESGTQGSATTESDFLSHIRGKVSRNRERTLASTEFAAQIWRKRLFEVWTIIGACALVAVGAYAMNIFAIPVGILMWCIVFVFCLRPLVNWLHLQGIGRAAGTLISYVVMVLIIVILAVVMLSPTLGISNQFSSLFENLPAYYTQLQNWMEGIYLQYADVLQNPTIQSWLDSATNTLYVAVGSVGQATANSLFDVGTFVANSCMVIGFAMVISFWVLMELPGLRREFRRLVPEHRVEDMEMLTTTLTSVIGGYLKGMLLQCFLIGLASGIAYAAIGLPSPAALGIITGLLNIIPVVGPWLGGVLAAAVGLMVSPMAALIAIVASVVIQQVVYTFISPLIMADSVDIHPALSIFGLMCGSAVGGALGGLQGSIVGMLASIPIIAAAKALFVYYFEKRTGRRLVAPDGVFFKGDVARAQTDEANPRADATAPMPRVTSLTDLTGPQRFPERHFTAEESERRKSGRKKKKKKQNSMDNKEDDNTE